MAESPNVYNYYEMYEELKALAFQLLMSEEVCSLDGPHASTLWEIVGSMDQHTVDEAVARHAARSAHGDQS